MRKSSLITIGVMLFLIIGMVVKLLTPDDIKPKNVMRAVDIPVTEIPAVTIQESDSTRKIKDIYVYITGEVNKPGVYKFSQDARIFQAVEAAGGFTSNADQASLNLAENMIDGIQLEVLPKGAIKAQASQNPKTPPVTRPAPVKVNQPQNVKAASQNTAGQVDINNASEQELTRLKGVGPAIAKRIIDYRNKNGRFTRSEDLLNVRGIGEKTLEKMRSQILIR